MARYAAGPNVSDEALMERYAAGDVEAFDLLFRRCEPRAYAFFLKRTGSPERAQDLYQELFLRIHRGRHRYDPSRPFTPWFFQIANRLLVDDHRRAFRSREVPIEGREPRAETSACDAQLASRELVERMLQTLSPAERYIVVSAKVEGVGYPELAKHLGKSVDAVKKTASRAIQKLRCSAVGGADGERIHAA